MDRQRPASEVRGRVVYLVAAEQHRASVHRREFGGAGDRPRDQIDQLALAGFDLDGLHDGGELPRRIETEATRGRSEGAFGQHQGSGKRLD